MSIKAMTLVEERTRAKGSNLGVLRAIADYAKDDGRHAFPSPPTLAWKLRMTARAAELIVRKLVADGEVAPEWNQQERRLYLHIRCICEWEAYRAEGPIPQREKISRNVSEKFARSLIETAASRSKKPASDDEKTARDDSSSEKNPVENSVSDGDREASAPHPLLTVNDPSIDPLEREAAAPPSLPVAAQPAPEPKPDPLEAFRELWNATISEPLKPCLSLTKRRRRWIRACLTERPLEAWRDVFERANRSRICRGERPGGWVMSFDQLIGSSDTAVRLLEGQWDNRQQFERPFTAQELADARRVRANAVGCPHQPRCANAQACEAAIIRKWRRDRGEAA